MPACTFGSVQSGVFNPGRPLPSAPWHTEHFWAKIVAPSPGFAAWVEASVRFWGAGEGEAESAWVMVRDNTSMTYFLPPRSRTRDEVEPSTNSTPSSAAKAAVTGPERVAATPSDDVSSAETSVGLSATTIAATERQMATATNRLRMF